MAEVSIMATGDSVNSAMHETMDQGREAAAKAGQAERR